MSQGNSGRRKARKELLEVDEVDFANTGTDLDSLVQEVLQSPGKPKKLSILLPKEPEDFIGDEENDDEKERQKEKDKREQQEKEKSSQQPASAFGVLTNLTPTELEDHYFQCLQLCNQNKVNVKNAFKLQLIDYMKLIFANHSKKTENLALMGYTLDASAKIYSYRVDKVYSDLMKIMSGKVFKETDGAGEDENKEEGGEFNHESDDDRATPKKKRKKHYEEEKDLDFEKVLCSESELQKTQSEGQSFLKERTTLPTHLEFFLECPLRDPYGLLCLNGPIFDTEEEEVNSAYISIGCKVEQEASSLDASLWLPGYKEMHKRYFLLGEANETLIVNKSLVYDSTIQENGADAFRRANDDDDDMQVDGMEPEQVMDYDDGFSDEEPDVPPSLTVHNTVNSSKNKTSFSVRGMSSMVSVTDNEFSFFDSGKLNFWAGPTHWSLKPKKRTPTNAVDQVSSKTSKKKFTIDFFNCDAGKIKECFSGAVCSLSKKTLRTWSKDRNKNLNFSYTRRHMLSLFHDENLVYVNKDFSAHGIFSAAKSKLLDQDDNHLSPNNFDCQDEGPEVNMLADCHADDHDDNDDGDAPQSFSPPPDDPSGTSSGLELLPAPPKVNKIGMNFSKTQKKVDMKLLKNTIWEYMDLESNPKENVPASINTSKDGKRNSLKSVRFSDVYASLPKLLPPEESSQLSCGIVFMAVLHLANEKTLSFSGDKSSNDFDISLG